MEFLEIIFPVSGVKTSLLVPPLVALVIGFVSSLGGLSGAFLILPFQMSVLGFVSPAVTSTNFVYNIVGIPGGLAAYIRERRMNWALAAVITCGTLPGLAVGYFIRVYWLPGPGRFKVFVGLVLLYLGARLFRDAFKRLKNRTENSMQASDNLIHMISTSLRRIEYSFRGESYSFQSLPLFFMSLGVGVVGGTYGIGGGALLAPFCVAVLGLPVYTVAGATLLATFIASLAGVFFYTVLPSPIPTSPDWLLGALFGIGGLVGMYLGGRAQIYVPQRIVKFVLGAILLGLALRYILGGL